MINRKLITNPLMDRLRYKGSLSLRDSLKPLFSEYNFSNNFHPNSLPGFVSSPIVNLMRKRNKLWQNSGKTIQASADGDLVYVPQDTFSSIEYPSPSNSRRTTLKQDASGRWYLQFDGANSVHISPTGGGISGDLTLWAAVSIVNHAGYSSVMGIGEGLVSGKRRAMAVRHSNRLEFNGANADATTTNNFWTENPNDPQIAVVTRTGQTIKCYLNGVEQEIGNPSATYNSFSETNITIGCTPTALAEFTEMNLYGWGVHSAVLTQDEITLLNNYLSLQFT